MKTYEETLSSVLEKAEAFKAAQAKKKAEKSKHFRRTEEMNATSTKTKEEIKHTT